MCLRMLRFSRIRIKFIAECEGGGLQNSLFQNLCLEDYSKVVNKTTPKRAPRTKKRRTRDASKPLSNLFQKGLIFLWNNPQTQLAQLLVCRL